MVGFLFYICAHSADHVAECFLIPHSSRVLLLKYAKVPAVSPFSPSHQMAGSLMECLGVSWVLAYQLGLKLILYGLLDGKWYGGSFDMSRPDVREYGLEYFFKTLSNDFLHSLFCSLMFHLQYTQSFRKEKYDFGLTVSYN